MRHLSTSVTTTAYKITRTLIGVECDICGKFIPTNHQRYFEITTGHNDWGNDSIESIETQDVCSECAPKFIEEYLSDCSDTAYLRVEAEYTWAQKTSEVVDRKPDEGEIVKEDHCSYW